MVKQIYLDNAASTAVDPRVAEAMHECLLADNSYGNAAADLHDYGTGARQLIDKARLQVATLIGGDPDGVVWTSGATESDNLAILGVARFRGEMQGKHIVTSITEHSAVLQACRQLETEGFEVTFLHPDAEGRITADQVRKVLRDNTILVSLMHVNNETGVVQDVAAIGQLCDACDILFHVDAVQSAGRLLLDVRAQKIDLLSLSAHKIYGPKGVGVLYLNRSRVNRLEPLMFGGGQEHGLRPGTLATHQIVGMGRSCELAAELLSTEPAVIAALRDRLWAAIDDIPGLIWNCAGADLVCGILSVSVSGVEGEALIYALRELAVASGSACNTANDDASYVLRALGRDDQLAQSTVRFSLGRFNTENEVDRAAMIFRNCVTDLRSYSAYADEMNQYAV